MENLRKFFSSKNRVLKTAIGLVLLILVVSSLYFYNQYQKTKSLLENPSAASSTEIKTLITQVGKLIELPANEDPTLATVSDKTKLENQAFFANAENGDKVLIYTKAKKAILYRPSTNKIIEVAPINIGQNEKTPNVSITPILTPTVTP